jgi:hypothetical protein
VTVSELHTSGYTVNSRVCHVMAESACYLVAQLHILADQQAVTSRQSVSHSDSCRTYPSMHTPYPIHSDTGQQLNEAMLPATAAKHKLQNARGAASMGLSTWLAGRCSGLGTHAT